jgi:O-antigen ligase
LDFWACGKIVLRQWLIVVPVLSVTGALAVGAFASAPPAWQTQALVALVGPAVAEESIVDGISPEPANPVVEWGDRLRVATQVLASSLNLDEAVEEIEQEGGKVAYEVQMSSPDDPVLHLAVTARTAQGALRFMQAVLEQIEAQTARVQRIAGASPELTIRPQVLLPPSPPTRTWATNIRLAGAILAGGITAAMSLAFMKESLARTRRRAWRRRRRQVHSEASEQAASFHQRCEGALRHGGSWDLARRHAIQRDAVTLLTAYTSVLILLPSRLVIAGISYDVTPAVALGLLGLLWWWNARQVAGLGVSTGAQPVRAAILIFALALCISHIAAMTRPLPGDELRSADRLLVIMLSWFGVALLSADGIHSRARLDTLLERLVTAGTMLSALGIVQFFAGVDITSLFNVPGLEPIGSWLIFTGQRASFRRVAATALHPIEFGVVLATLLPIALHYAYHNDVGKGRRWAKASVIAFGIPLSVSRSSIVGVFAGVLVLVPTWSWRRVRGILLAIPLLLIGLQYMAPGLLGTLTSLFLGIAEDPSYQGRTQDYSVVGEFIASSPIVGRGLGTFLPRKYVLLDNQYLGTMIEMGAAGLLALLLLFAVAFFTARGARRQSTDETTRNLAQSLAAAVLCLTVTFATFDGFAFQMVSGLMFLLFGCSGALWRLCRRQDLASAFSNYSAVYDHKKNARLDAKAGE